MATGDGVGAPAASRMLKNSASALPIPRAPAISSARPHSGSTRKWGHLLEPSDTVQLLAHHYVLREYLR